MSDNELLARWQGWKDHNGTWSAPTTLLPKNVPDYLNHDTAAMSLLDTLVEKGHDVRIQSFIADPEQERWQVSIWRIEPHEDYCIVDLFAPTISAAITQAVLKLIESEAQDE